MFTVEIKDLDGNQVFVGYLEPDQFKIIHYPDKPSRLEITMSDETWASLTTKIDKELIG